MSTTSELPKPVVFLRNVWPYVLVVAILSMALWLGCSLGPRGLRVPFNFRSANSDLNHHLMVAKTIAEGGWWWEIPRQSAPFGLDMVLFPVGGSVDYFIMKLMTVATTDPGLLLNGFWLFSILLAGCTAFYALRSFEIKIPLAVACACIYAILPHIFYRSLAHLMLVHYLLPIPVSAAVRLAAGTWFQMTPMRRSINILFCLLLGLNYTYFAFFTCFLLVVAGIRSLLSLDYRSALAGAACIIAVGIGTFLHLAPSMSAWSQDPVAKANIERTKNQMDADIFGLKIRHLLLPAHHHPFNIWRKASKKIQKHPFPLENENVLSYIGIFSSVGLVLLIMTFFRRGLAFETFPYRLEMNAAAVLVVACLLLCTIGGFGSLFNLMISNQIRCYCRINPFIAFLGLLALAFMLQYWSEREALFKPLDALDECDSDDWSRLF